MTDLFKDRADGFDANDTARQLSANVSACILSNVTLEPGMDVMDFGAGTGLVTAQLAARVDKVTCVDVSEAMLDKLASKDELKGKVDIRRQNILEQPIGKQFDLIVSAMAMHHVEDTDRMVMCFARHLKPGGTVALADLDEEDGSFHPADIEGVHHSGFSRDAFKRILEKHGFADVSFFDAHTVIKEGRQYPVFLAVATRS